MTGAPYMRDLDDVRRGPTLDDLSDVPQALATCLPALHSTAHHIVEPMDMIGQPPASAHHLFVDETFRQDLHGHDHQSGKNAEDVMEMCAILFGAEYHGEHTPSSPATATAIRPWSGTKPCWVPCAPSASATSRSCARPSCWAAPIPRPRVAPAVAQLNAEALSALAYTQVIRKGCPAIYGHYLSTVSMKSGAPMAGTPEISLMNFMIGQMARYLRRALAHLQHSWRRQDL